MRVILIHKTAPSGPRRSGQHGGRRLAAREENPTRLTGRVGHSGPFRGHHITTPHATQHPSGPSGSPLPYTPYTERHRDAYQMKNFPSSRIA
jgi:hypothetical protein